MDNTTRLSQKIHQNAKNAPNKAHLNNRTEIERKKEKNQTICEANQKKNTLERSGAEWLLMREEPNE